jgi:hypothetical protein
VYMTSSEFPVEDFQRCEVTIEVGEEIDLSKLPVGSKTFDDQSWYEAARAIEAAATASISPVYLLVGDNPNSMTGPRMRSNGVLPAAGGLLEAIINPELEVLPVGRPAFYDSQTGALQPDEAADENEIEADGDPAPFDQNEDAMVPDEVGLFRVDMGGLQASIAVVIEHALVQAYIVGRLDQANQGKKQEPFITRRELGAVAAQAEWLTTFTPRNHHTERARRIINRAIKKSGSIAAALGIEQPAD